MKTFKHFLDLRRMHNTCQHAATCNFTMCACNSFISQMRFVDICNATSLENRIFKFTKIT